MRNQFLTSLKQEVILIQVRIYDQSLAQLVAGKPLGPKALLLVWNNTKSRPHAELLTQDLTRI